MDIQHTRRSLSIAFFSTLLAVPMAVHAENQEKTQTQKLTKSGAHSMSDEQQDERMKAKQELTDSDAYSKSDKQQRARMKTTEEREKQQEVIVKATQVYSALSKNTQSDIAEKARCIAVFPNVRKAALAIGGTKGDGIATCRTENGWSKLSFLDIRGASFGAQLGTTSTDVVIYFLNEDAEETLRQNQFDLGADLSATAGAASKSATFDLNKHDAVVVNDKSGIFAGASLDGVQMSPDSSLIEEYYGEKLEHSDLLSSEAGNDLDQVTQAFLDALPTS